jgi:ATP synthase in type III secretion protein N
MQTPTRADRLAMAATARAPSDELDAALDRFRPLTRRGRIQQAVGLLIEARGVQAHLGELCELVTPGRVSVWAEVVGITPEGALLTPLGRAVGLSPSTEVVPQGEGLRCPVGEGLLGRVLDGLGRPIDGLGELRATEWRAVHAEPPPPLERQLIDRVLPTGVRAIDALFTLGVGQRIGVFSPPGAGKSTLLGMLAKGSRAASTGALANTVNVIALVGERGREVREFLARNLDDATRARTVMVVSTSERPAMERVASALMATTIAEHFRDRGADVLLLFDSLTRLARAQREIGLASGEPPTRRSYPPSVFALLPQLLERAGPGARGSITAVYSVLTEGDEENDPIAEEVRAIVDGHLVLSRKLAAAQHYPAIDVTASVSRLMAHLVSPAHRDAAAHIRSLLAKHAELELLLQIGEYRPGQDALADEAVRLRGAIDALLRQGSDEVVPFDAAVRTLGILRGPPQ